MGPIAVFIVLNLISSFSFSNTSAEYRTKYQKECIEKNNIASCLEAGRSTMFSPDILNAKIYYSHACKLGAPHACELALVPEVKIKKSAADKLKCDTKNDATSCKDYGSFMDYAHPESPDGDNYRLKACNLKESAACYILGYDYEQRENFDKAYELYTKACALDDEVGCRWAAAIEIRKRNNFDKGLELLSKACLNKKMEGACYKAGFELMKRQKYVEAEKYMSHSVKLKGRGSRYRLAEITEFAVLERDLNTRESSQKISCEKALAEKFTAIELEGNEYSVNNEKIKRSPRKTLPYFTVNVSVAQLFLKTTAPIIG